jgi:hypothetical protein
MNFVEHEIIRGKLLYTSKKPEIAGKVRGVETLIIAKHIDCRCALRARSAIDANSPLVLRDSIAGYVELGR